MIPDEHLDRGDSGVLDWIVLAGLVLACIFGGVFAANPQVRAVVGCVLGGGEPGWCLDVADDLGAGR